MAGCGGATVKIASSIFRQPCCLHAVSVRTNMTIESATHNKLDTDHGYLKSHHLSLHNSVSEEQLKQLSSLKTDEERFSFVYSLPLVHEHEVKAAIDGKNEEEARKLKEDGNKAFQSGKYNSALQGYTKSILKTPWGKG